MSKTPRYRTTLHKKNQKRDSAHKRGYDANWRKASKSFLRAYPMCERHLDRDQWVPASVVDHVIPHKGDYELFWDEENWQSLCKRCHDHKTATEDGGFGR